MECNLHKLLFVILSIYLISSSIINTSAQAVFPQTTYYTDVGMKGRTYTYKVDIINYNTSSDIYEYYLDSSQGLSNGSIIQVNFLDNVNGIHSFDREAGFNDYSNINSKVNMTIDGEPYNILENHSFGIWFNWRHKPLDFNLSYVKSLLYPVSAEYENGTILEWHEFAEANLSFTEIKVNKANITYIDEYSTTITERHTGMTLYSRVKGPLLELEISSDITNDEDMQNKPSLLNIKFGFTGIFVIFACIIVRKKAIST